MSAQIEEKNVQPAGYARLRLERRAKPRVSFPFWATVQGVSKDGTSFEVATIVDNLAAGGLYLRITKEVEEGTRLLVNICMNCHTLEHQGPCLNLEVYGQIIRVERISGGAYGVAVSFTNSVFITK